MKSSAKRISGSSTSTLLFVLHLYASNAHACIDDGSSFSIPPFVLAFLSSIFITSVLASLIWGINKLLFRHKFLLPWLTVFTVILAIAIGMLGSFGIPQYQAVFSEFTMELPFHTEFIFNFNYSLWLPCIALIGLWFLFSKNGNLGKYLKIILFLEVVLLLMVIWSIYSNIFLLGALC